MYRNNVSSLPQAAMLIKAIYFNAERSCKGCIDRALEGWSSRGSASPIRYDLCLIFNVSVLIN